jgi:hypothetical protein
MLAERNKMVQEVLGSLSLVGLERPIVKGGVLVGFTKYQGAQYRCKGPEKRGLNGAAMSMAGGGKV